MTKQRAVYSAGDVVSAALRMFELEWLALLLKLFDDVRESSGYGGLEIIISDGKVQSIKKVESYKA